MLVLHHLLEKWTSFKEVPSDEIDNQKCQIKSFLRVSLIAPKRFGYLPVCNIFFHENKLILHGVNNEHISNKNLVSQISHASTVTHFKISKK